MPKVSQAKNEVGFTPRKGQLELIEWCSDSIPGKDRVAIQWPTGYGKSIGMALIWKHVKEAGVANRCLIVVGPNGIQRQQIYDGFAGDCQMVGASCKGGVWCFERCATDLNQSKRGVNEVFVCTIGQLHASMSDEGDGLNVLRELLVTGDGWFIAFDEYQHLGEEMKWGESAKRVIPYAKFVCAMSATPYRRGVGTIFGEPDLVVTYQDASENGEVKRIVCESYGYEVTAIIEGKDPENYTTQELLKSKKFKAETGLDAWEERKNLRFSTQYVHPLVREPVERLKEKSIKHGKPLQMLVRAMSCAHADSVCKQIRSLIHKSMSVDWVGTGTGEGQDGRPSSENDDVIKRFCPPKDGEGNRVVELDILVQVGMAGEGFDSVDVCEIVDLYPVSKKALSGRATVDKQFYGRGSRIITDAVGSVDLHVSVPTDHPLSMYAKSTLDAWMDHVGKTPPPGEPVQGELDPFELPDLVDKRIITLSEINRDSAPYRRIKEGIAKAMPNFDATTEAGIQQLDEWYLGTQERVANRESTQATMKQLRKALDTAAGKLSYVLMKQDTKVSMTERAVYKKNVNQLLKRRYGPRDGMSEEKLREAYTWVQRTLENKRPAELSDESN